MTVDTTFTANILLKEEENGQDKNSDYDETTPEQDDVEEEDGVGHEQFTNFHKWSPSGVWWRDLFHFVGPGWFVAIAYVDPGNYQADIQAGATSRYTLLFTLWWSSILSIYVQVLCVRLSLYGQVTLAEAQARDLRSKTRLRYFSWFLAELSTVLTDLPEVVGVGIALNIFLGWPYYVGVILSLFTTMIFLFLLNFGLRTLEIIICVFVGIMSIALWVEMGFVGVSGAELMEGWTVGFLDITKQDIFAITGILGAVVMPHNLYLHSAACMSRRVERNPHVIQKAVQWCSIEPIVPIVVSFFVNMAVVAISAENVFGTDGAEHVGLTDFCNYFRKLKGGCVLWAIALLAAGQSSAITTTFAGQYVMDGLLHIRLPVALRAVVTRLVAITPCIIVSIMFPQHLNQMVNIVNSALSFLLPFAFTPLVKYNCSSAFLGQFAAIRFEKWLLYGFAIGVWVVNALALSSEGGGMIGSARHSMEMGPAKVFLIILEVCIQVFYFVWNAYILFSKVTVPMTPIEEERPYDDQFAQATLT